MNKEELIHELCEDDEDAMSAGESMSALLRQKLAAVPDDADVRLYRRDVESAIDSIMGAAHQAICHDADQAKVIEVIWTAYLSDLSSLLE